MIKGVFLLIFITNIARYSVVAPLHDVPLLDVRAQARAEQLCRDQQWSHDGWENAFTDTAYQWKGENLSKNFRTYYDAFIALWNSPEHHDNMMNPHYTSMGVGEACNLQVELFGG